MKGEEHETHAGRAWRRRPLVGTTVVDAHAHLGPYSRFFIPGSGADQMVAVMDRTGTDLAVLSSNRAIQLDAARGNDLTAAAVDRHPDRLAGYVVVNPWQRPAAEITRAASDLRFLGVKLHPDLHDYPLDGSRYQEVYEFASATGCPVLTHTWHTSPHDNLQVARRVLDRWPGLRLLLGHSGASAPGVDASILLAQRCPGAVLEICGSHMSGALLESMVAGVGADRVVFGSDFPFIDQRISLGRVVFSGLDARQQQEVLGGAAVRLFAWRPHPVLLRQEPQPTPPNASGRHSAPRRLVPMTTERVSAGEGLDA